MLSGIAPALKERFGLPVACLLQGEETFLEALREPFRSGALQRLRSNARYVDRFIAPGEAYAGAMAEYLGVPRERVVTIRAGIDPTPYRNSQPVPAEPFTIGYLSVIHRPKGLDLLVEAWRILVHEMGREARLVVAGRVMDPRYWRETLEAVDRAGMREAFRFAGEVDRQAKIDLLRGCSVFCVPSRFAESRGIAVLEAQAAGVPVVVPNSGIYPEMLALTGGGFLHEPENAGSIAERLAHVHDDPGAARAIGCAGADGVARHFGADAMVAATLAVYEQMVRMRPGAS
jgi:glycosyltransferase involved in cell wall biosynthesis